MDIVYVDKSTNPAVANFARSAFLPVYTTNADRRSCFSKAAPDGAGVMLPSKGGPHMSTLEDVRTLRGTALRLLPGICQARMQLDVMINVLEYFARDAIRALEYDSVVGE